MLEQRRISGSNPTASAILLQNTVFVDGTYGNDGTGLRENSSRPFKTIAAGEAAAIADDMVDISAGSYAGETFDPTKNLFVSAAGVTVDSISYANGRLRGRFGKMLLNHTCAEILADEDEVDNGICAKFLLDLVSTVPSGRFNVVSHSGRYDIKDLILELANPGTDIADWTGEGATKPIYHSSTAAPGNRIFRNFVTNSFKDMIFHTNGTSGTGISCLGNVDVTAHITGCESYNQNDLTQRSMMRLSTGTGKFTGFANDNVAEIIESGSDVSTGEILHHRGSITSTAHSGELSFIPAEGAAIALTDFTGHADFTKLNNLTSGDSPSAAGEFTLGFLKFWNASQSDTPKLAGKYKGLRHYSTVADISQVPLAGCQMTPDFSLTDFRLINGAGTTDTVHTLYEEGAELSDGVLALFHAVGIAGSSRARTVENKATWTRVTIDHTDVSTDVIPKFTVSDGCVLNDVTFRGFKQGSVNPLDSAVCGRDLTEQYQDGTEGLLFWDFSEQKIAWEVKKGRPQQDDGAGGYEDIPVSTPFNAMLYTMPLSVGDGDGDLTLCIGLLVELEIIVDAANLHGFGVSAIVIRSTANSAVALDAAMGSPAADVTADAGGRGAQIGMAATITVNGDSSDGVQYGEEITVERDDVVTVTTTTYDATGSEEVIYVDDDAAGGVVTINMAPSRHISNHVTIKKLGTTGNVVIDGNEAETIDGAATLTLTSQFETAVIDADGTNLFIVA